MINASDRRKAIELIKNAVNSGAQLVRACEELNISKRTFNRWKNSEDFVDKRTTCKRPEPANKLKKEEIEEILKTVNNEEYSSLPPSQIVPKLADKGIYLASESTIYRVLKNHGSINRSMSKKAVKRPLSTHKATAPNQVYMWDITYLNGPIKGTHFYLYLISDLFSRKIVAWEVWEKETATHASDLIRRAVISEKIATQKIPLVLHSDNGSPMKGATMLETLYTLGITPSRSRPRVSNDNPYAESIFKTLKYRPSFQPKGFPSIEQARMWVNKFVNWYNNEHKHSGIAFVSPSERHDGKAEEILANRKSVYEKAKLKNPERWSRNIRKWDFEKEVWLNPERLEKREYDLDELNKSS